MQTFLNLEYKEHQDQFDCNSSRGKLKPSSQRAKLDSNNWSKVGNILICWKTNKVFVFPDSLASVRQTSGQKDQTERSPRNNKKSEYCKTWFPSLLHLKQALARLGEEDAATQTSS